MAAIRLAMAIDAYNPTIGDLYVGANGQTRMTASLSEEVQQMLYQRFQFFLGEWYLLPTAGIPWFQRILGVKNTSDNISNILRSVITTCPGVASLTSFSLNRDGRTIAPRFSCTLTNGAVLTQADFPPFVLAPGA